METLRGSWRRAGRPPAPELFLERHDARSPRPPPSRKAPPKAARKLAIGEGMHGKHGYADGECARGADAGLGASRVRRPTLCTEPSDGRRQRKMVGDPGPSVRRQPSHSAPGCRQWTSPEPWAGGPQGKMPCRELLSGAHPMEASVAARPSSGLALRAGLARMQRKDRPRSPRLQVGSSGTSLGVRGAPGRAGVWAGFDPSQSLHPPARKDGIAARRVGSISPGDLPRANKNSRDCRRAFRARPLRYA